MAVDHTAWHLACRARAASLSVCTTGAVTLAATTTGYTRAAGSFLTDGLSVGMEITPAGFASNPVDVITAVTATAVTTKNARTAESAAAGRSLAVGLPSSRAYENKAFTAVVGVPYVVEQYIPGPSMILTVGPRADVECTPMYALHIYVPADVGISADGKYADAILAHFCPRTAMTLTSGDVLRVRTDIGPFRAQRSNAVSGWSVIPVTIPLRITTVNTL